VNIVLKERLKNRTLFQEVRDIAASLVTLDGGHAVSELDDFTGVCLRCWLAEDDAGPWFRAPRSDQRFLLFRRQFVRCFCRHLGLNVYQGFGSNAREIFPCGFAEDNGLRVTNTFQAPETIIRALHKQNDLYNAGEVDSSVTQLIQPARVSLLRKLHYKDMIKDVSQEFWALLGSGVHHLLEMGATANMVVEERLFMNIDGWRISGAIDCQEIHGNEVDIIDYKVTNTYSISKSGEPKEDWVHQLNLQALLLEANKPLRVRSLSICAILRNWSSSDAQRDPFYPRSPIVMVEIPIWPKARQLDYARDRITAHRNARFAHEMGEEVEECAPSDRWMRGDKWVVIKKGGKRATKSFDNPLEAHEMEREKGVKDYEVQYRAGKSTRCDYCGVKEWCNQYQNIIKPAEMKHVEASEGV
jgi:hypothetical protein